MPTLKDIQEEMTKRFDENFEEVILDQEVRIVVKGIKLFIESEISLAFQAGEKSKEDMVLKEIEKEKNIYHCFCNNGSCISHGYNLALSSLKEKIISNSK